MGAGGAGADDRHHGLSATPPPVGRPQSQPILAVIPLFNPEWSAVQRLLNAACPVADRILVVWNSEQTHHVPAETAHTIPFAGYNRGTAGAWNAGLSYARDAGFDFLMLLDQDTRLSAASLEAIVHERAETRADAITQPVRESRTSPPFPWNSVASGSLISVAALAEVDGFDESLFVDEVDHDVLSRLRNAGYDVRSLHGSPTHVAGAPEPLTRARLTFQPSGHEPTRRWMQARSIALASARLRRVELRTSSLLLLSFAREVLKDQLAGRKTLRVALAGLWEGFTADPPKNVAERPCPFCEGLLLGRFAAVPDWRFDPGLTGDVYRCASCGSLAAGRVPSGEVIATWYATYYTHEYSVGRTHRFWPLPGRRRELLDLDTFGCASRAPGSILEVGAGSGERTVRLADLGWYAVGQDPDPEAGSAAKAAGVAFVNAGVTSMSTMVGAFDVVGMAHVIEHVGNPRDFLSTCLALLSAEGELVVLTPNAAGAGATAFGRWWYGMEQPRHLGIPTLRGLQELASRLDAEVVELRASAAHSSVIMGGSIEGLWSRQQGPAPRWFRYLAALLGQASARVAVWLAPNSGDEIVWRIRPGRRS